MGKRKRPTHDQLMANCDSEMRAHLAHVAHTGDQWNRARYSATQWLLTYRHALDMAILQAQLGLAMQQSRKREQGA